MKQRPLVGVADIFGREGPGVTHDDVGVVAKMIERFGG